MHSCRITNKGYGATAQNEAETNFHVGVFFIVVRHLHEDEEIRAILEGTGYFDIRGKATHNR